MKKFLFVDLDDTLFQTLPKWHSQTGHSPDGAADPQAAGLRPVAFLSDGAPISWATPGQQAFLQGMMREMQLIPATARNHNAFSRVDLPFNDYAIIDYGGVILRPDRSYDPIWHQRMQAPMQAASAGLALAQQVIDDYAKRIGWVARSRMVSDFDTPFYLMIKDPHGEADKLAQLEQACLLPWLASVPQLAQDYYLHRNANNLALLPRTLNKAHAVAYLRERLVAEHGPILALGMGDSHSDASFMAACDYAIIPKHSQLAAMALAPLVAQHALATPVNPAKAQEQP